MAERARFDEISFHVVGHIYPVSAGIALARSTYVVCERGALSVTASVASLANKALLRAFWGVESSSTINLVGHSFVWTLRTTITHRAALGV